MWGHRHDRLYPNTTKYEFDLLNEPSDPKQKRRWKKVRWLVLVVGILFLLGIVIRWEEWLAGDDPNFVVGELTWPGFNHGEKVFSLRCYKNCSNHAQDVCNPEKETYCTCQKGYLGFDCSLALCTKCRIPDVLVIGVQKGGTTALNNYLRLNPAFMTSQKDHFFDDHWDRGLFWYFSVWDYSSDYYEGEDVKDDSGEDAEEEDDQLEINEADQIDATESDDLRDSDREAARDSEELEIEADVKKNDLNTGTNTSVRQKIKVGGSPKYIISDIAIPRLYALHPTVKFIVLLRDPVTRAYSGALMNERKGYFTHDFSAQDLDMIRILWKESKRQQRISKYRQSQNSLGEQLAMEEEMVLGDAGELPPPPETRKLLSTKNLPDSPELAAARERLQQKMEEAREKPFTPADTERVLTRGVNVIQACLDEARSLYNTSFFREVVSFEMETLIKERGTDLEAFYEWKACFSTQAPLITSIHTVRNLADYKDIEWLDEDGLVIPAKPGYARRLIIVRSMAWTTIARGMYYHQLNEWFTYFNKEQFYFIRSEDMMDDPQEILDGVHSWLGAPEHKYPEGRMAPVNSATNSEPMTEATRETLAAFYEPFNRKLHHLLGQNMKWD